MVIKAGSKTILILIVAILISGCIQSPETKQFAQNLSQTNEHLKISLRGIHTDLNEYGDKYEVNRWANSLLITDSMINKMEKDEGIVRDRVSKLEGVISAFQTAKQSADANQLSREERDLMNQIEGKIAGYNMNKRMLYSCLTSMGVYREWVRIVKEETRLTALLSIQSAQVKKHFEAEEYQEARDQISEVQGVIARINESRRKREALGIRDLPYDEARGAYDKLFQAYDHYREYIDLLIKGEYDAAEEKYEEYSKKRSEARSLEIGALTSGGKNKYLSEVIDEAVNKVEGWHQAHIGVCFSMFKEY